MLLQQLTDNSRTSRKNQPTPLKLGIFCACLFLFASGLFANASERVVKVLLDEHKDYGLLQVSAKKNNGFKNSLKISECPTIYDQMFAGAYRFELELAIVCNALREADLADRMDFLPFRNVS